ncbi:MAG: protein-disulfide reductase DsbD family protein [Planctomycetota bacterium]|jgi:thiol:disulfide interchange protein
MRKKVVLILSLVLILTVNTFSAPVQSAGVVKADIVTISVERQHDAVQPDSKSALAVHFELKKDWHFYASAKTAPAGMNLKLVPSAEEDYIIFSQAIFSQPITYFDKSSGKELEVFSDEFTVFLPFSVGSVIFEANEPVHIGIKIGFDGAVCSDRECRVPDLGQLSTTVKIIPFPDPEMTKAKCTLPALTKKGADRQTPTGGWVDYSVWFALGLAFLAGLSLNIMPCVWPVLPIIVMRIVEQAKQSKGRSIVMGLALCLGILLFFACLAGANIILQVFYNTALQWGDQFRNPAFLAGMALLLVVLALFMFGVFTITLPSSIAGKSGPTQGYSGAIGMGFLAAILSTPCSFAILAAAFAWAQVQRLALGTTAIMVIGVGMAAPYAILTSMPGLLKRTPKPGRWMELFKQTIGFILLIIAVKFIAAVPEARITGLLYFAVILAFCVWMWAGWVTYNTKPSRKRLIRIIAIILAVAAGWIFLPAPPGELIDWQEYDPAAIETAKGQERPVLIKFTADWCWNCDVVDKIVYRRKDIGRLIEDKGVLAIKADTTVKGSPAYIDLGRVYGELSLPVSILFTPGQKEPLRWRGRFFFARELKAVLKKLPSREYDDDEEENSQESKDKSF